MASLSRRNNPPQQLRMQSIARRRRTRRGGRTTRTTALSFSLAVSLLGLLLLPLALAQTQTTAETAQTTTPAVPVPAQSDGQAGQAGVAGTETIVAAVQLLQNTSALPTSIYSTGQLYTLYFTLDGPSGDGLLRKPSQILDFSRYMQNITLTFPPEFATVEEIRNVSTKCTYLSQRSFDTDLSVVANAKQIAFLTTPSTPKHTKQKHPHLSQKQSYSYYSRSRSIFFNTLSPPFSVSAIAVKSVSDASGISSRQAQTQTQTPQQQGQQQEAVTAAEEELEEENPIWEAILRANTTYQYTYLMNYSSNTVNVSLYPRYYEAKMRNSKHAFEAKMRQILNVSQGNVLTIQDILVGPPNTVNGIDGTSVLDDPTTTSEALQQNGGSLTINVTNNIYNNGTLTTVNISTTSPMTTLPPSLLTPTSPPPVTATLAPSQIPSVSSAPSVSSCPSISPTRMPSVQPTRFPTVSPTMYPTFVTNSSSRGRYELTYIVETSRPPKSLFINKTIFCEIMSNYTVVLAKEEGHNPEQIYTTCPNIDGGFTVTAPIYANLPPYQSPVLGTGDEGDGGKDGDKPDGAPPAPAPTIQLPQDTDGDGDLDIPIPPTFATPPPTPAPTTPPEAPTAQPLPPAEDVAEDLAEELAEDLPGGRFLRQKDQRVLQLSPQPVPTTASPPPPTISPSDFPTETPPTTGPSVAPSTSVAPSDAPSISFVPTISNEPSSTPTTSPAPTATPSWTYRYTIVMRWTSRYWNVSDYPDNLELYLQNETNQQDLETQLILKFNLTTSVESLRVITFQQFTDITKAPTDEPSSSPSTQPSSVTTLHPTDPEPTIPPIPQNATAPPDLGSDPQQPSADTPSPSSLPPGSSPRPTPRPAGGDGDGGDGGKNNTTIVIAACVVVVVFSSLLMLGLIRLYKKRREAKRNAYNNVINKDGHSRRPSEGTAGVMSGEATGMMPPSLPTDPISTAGTQPSPLSDPGTTSPPKYMYSPPNATTAAKPQQQKQPPHHAKDHSSGSTSLASTVSDAAGSAQGSQMGGRPMTTTTVVAANSPARSILSDIEEDPYSTDGIGDDDDDDDIEPDSGAVSPSRLRLVPVLSSSGSSFGGAGGSNGASVLDPFAQYNDSKLERMRTNVEGNVTGLDGMMSQAMTRAYMTTDQSASGHSSTDTPVWHGATSGVEIEANALWEVMEFLKRHPHSGDDQKQEYMQQLLEKMVTTVREGYVDPEDASRTIHECAHLLGLELANQLPMETILLTGMQKTTTAQDVTTTMKAFGPVVDAAVASGQRGFGFVRFKTHKSIAAAMHQHRTSEVVIKNVAITLRLLSEQDEFHV